MRNIAEEREKDTHCALFINSAIKRKKGLLFTDILRETTVTSIESNPVNVYYRLTDNEVVVYIRLSPEVEYMPFEGSGQATESK